MLSTHNSFFDTLRDPSVRAGVYVWLMIAGMAVLLANAVGA